MHGLFGLYSPRYPRALVGLMQSSNYHVSRFLSGFLRAADVRPFDASFTVTKTAQLLLISCWCIGTIVVAAALWLVLAWSQGTFAGGIAFGAALAIAIPLLMVGWLMMAVAAAKVFFAFKNPRRTGKKLLCTVLEAQVTRLRAKHDIKVVAVVGSIGKTSTKLAIAHTLQASRRVIFQEGNYNDRLTVPLVLFGHSLPGLLNLPAWIRILLANERTIKKPYPYDIAVLELGTDGPGQIKDFAYLQPDIAIVTAVTPEHMEFFKTLDAVATEELSITEFSTETIINKDDCSEQFVIGLPVTTYGIHKDADVRVTSWKSQGLDGISMKLQVGSKILPLDSPMFGAAGAKITAAAAAVALRLGLSTEEITSAIKGMPDIPGRMQILRGAKGSVLIDDTYNASPAAVNAGLDVLYALSAPKRIAILGSMNELGDYAPQAHREVGAHCDPKKLDLVVTIGKQAEELLAPYARENGCTVESFQSPYAAGRRVLQELKKGAVVLAEGSQNGVFAEEALKLLLDDPADSHKLVRQSGYWLTRKKSQFHE